MRHYPRRFGIGVPVVFVLAIGAGTLLAERNLSLALAVLLLIQTVGLLGLYVPALRERLREERRENEGAGSAGAAAEAAEPAEPAEATAPPDPAAGP